MKSLCVYCGSKTGSDPAHAEAAGALGRLLAARGVRLVYGGGRVGLMGILADACQDAGGKVTGIIPDFLALKEVAHPRVEDMRVVGSMHERKQAMVDDADGFAALPGGLGTLEELSEVWTWSQLGRHEKPVGLLNTAGYYDALLAFLDHMAAENFVEARHRAMLCVGETPQALMDALAAAEHPGAIAQLSRGQT